MLVLKSGALSLSEPLNKICENKFPRLGESANNARGLEDYGKTCLFSHSCYINIEFKFTVMAHTF